MQFPQEHELKLELGGRTAVRLLCTCDSLRELVTGFLFNEGLIASPGEIRELSITDDTATVRLAVQPRLPAAMRPSGLGSPVLGQDTPRFRPVRRRCTMPQLAEYVARMQALAVGYKTLGGMHCSALFHPEGMIAAFEDIGRHNTLDKLAGHCLLRDISMADTFLLTSGRISSDMVRKAARMGVSLIASYSTATQNALELAESGNITLIVYAGKNNMTVCAGKERMT